MSDQSEKFRNIFFIFIFLICLSVVSIYIIAIKEPILVSTQEKRNLTDFSKLSNSSFVDGSWQTILDKALADQFVFRYDIVRFKNVMDVKFTDLLIPQSEDEYKLTKVGETPIQRVGTSYYMINGLFDYDIELENRFIKRAEQINKLAKDYPNIEVFVYKPTQGHETSIFDEANNIESYGKYYQDVLKNALEVPYAELIIEDIHDYKNYYLQSDHHWSYQGSYQGYVDIIKLMFGNEEKVLNPIKLNTFNDELIFSGTFASRTGNIFPGEPFICMYSIYHITRFI